jgi:hypothetical protein
MSRSLAVIVTTALIIGGGQAYAQEVTPGPGKLEIAVIPGGAVFFTSKNDEPSFGNYGLGGGATYNFNRVVGIEGEVGALLAVSDLQFGELASSRKAPNMLGYTGNVILHASGHSVVPYVSGGIGGVTVFERASLGIDSTETLLTGNGGGGVKWYARNDRWGLRGDYRFLATRSRDNAPAFFGQETRYGHRVYGAVVINAVR